MERTPVRPRLAARLSDSAAGVRSAAARRGLQAGSVPDPRRGRSEPAAAGGWLQPPARSQGASSPCRSEQTHTAQFSRSVVVHYRWHPLFGRSLLVKQLRRGPAGSRSVVGLLPDNTWAMVPEWMTSREACAHCQLTEVPAVSLLALLELAAALDALPPGGRSSTISSKIDVVEEAGENGGKTHERQLESPAARVGVGGTNRLGSTAGADSASGSRRAGATADATRHGRGRGGGRR